VRQHGDSFPSDGLPIARKILEARGFHDGDQEALALVAALLENYPYKPSEIHADRVPVSWMLRMKELWATPPGFRDSVLERLLQEEYKGSIYYEMYKEGIKEARTAFVHPHGHEEHCKETNLQDPES